MKRIMALIAFLSMAEAVHAQNSDTYMSGKAVAEQICSECHAIREGQARSPNGIAPPFEQLANTPGMTSIALTAALRTSHRVMPNLILSDEQLRGVIAYVLSLRGAR